jgi:hypothetical protein
VLGHVQLPNTPDAALPPNVAYSLCGGRFDDDRTREASRSGYREKFAAAYVWNRQSIFYHALSV